MNTEEIMLQFKQHRNNFPIDDNTCDNVMQQIHRQKRKPAFERLSLWLDKVTLTPTARFWIIAIGTTGGLCRVTITFIAFIWKLIPLA